MRFIKGHEKSLRGLSGSGLGTGGDREKVLAHEAATHVALYSSPRAILGVDSEPRSWPRLQRRDSPRFIPSCP